MNISIILLTYYALFYSIGVASLIFALILRLTGNEALLGRFIVCTAAMTAIVVVSTALNVIGDSGGEMLRAPLRWLNLSLAAVFTYNIVAFAAEVFPFHGGRSTKRLALLISAASLLLCGFGIIRGATGWIDEVILVVKTIAVSGPSWFPGAGAIGNLPR